jgi:hypothetical protein
LGHKFPNPSRIPIKCGLWTRSSVCFWAHCQRLMCARSSDYVWKLDKSGVVLHSLAPPTSLRKSGNFTGMRGPSIMGVRNCTVKYSSRPSTRTSMCTPMTLQRLLVASAMYRLRYTLANPQNDLRSSGSCNKLLYKEGISRIMINPPFRIMLLRMEYWCPLATRRRPWLFLFPCPSCQS